MTSLHYFTHFERINMKILVTAIVSAFMLVSTAAFAGSHGGGKMDDKKDEKKVDCSKKENEKAKECEKKK